MQAQEAVRADTSTHLPLNITDQEVDETETMREYSLARCSSRALSLHSCSSFPCPHACMNHQVRIGRSRRNDVVLLRDPEVSKKHCKLWRDARGEVWWPQRDL